MYIQTDAAEALEKCLEEILEERCFASSIEERVVRESDIKIIFQKFIQKEHDENS